MSGFFNRVAKMVSFGSSKRLIGRDLEGNKYFELPGVNGGRPKRVVEYRIARDVADYTSGTNRLPGLSYTRANPPTTEELQSDFNRQQRLRPMVAAIEEREREERIRQGYLVESPSGPGGDGEAQRQIAGPSAVLGNAGGMGREEGRHSGLKYPQLNTGASFVTRKAPSNVPDRATPTPAPPSLASSDPSSFGNNAARQSGSESYPAGRQHPRDRMDTPNPPYTVPTPASAGVAPPSAAVDPSQHSSPEELRRLAEEDTKRRIKESASAPPTPEVAGGGEGVQGLGGGFKPRRRRG